MGTEVQRAGKVANERAAALKSSKDRFLFLSRYRFERSASWRFFSSARSRTSSPPLPIELVLAEPLNMTDAVPWRALRYDMSLESLVTDWILLPESVTQKPNDLCCYAYSVTNFT